MTDIYLAFIQSPAKASMNKLASDLKRGMVATQFTSATRKGESLQALGNHIVKNVTTADKKLDKLAKQLNVTVDMCLIFVITNKGVRLKPVAKARGIMIAAYSDMTTTIAERSLLARSRSLRLIL